MSGPSEPSERGRPSIARLWRGRTPVSKADAYVDFLHRRGLPDYRATEGNRGVELGDRPRFPRSLSLSPSPGGNRGLSPNRFLLEKEATVTHYEVRG